MRLETIHDFLRDGIPLLYDGAMGTELQKHGFGPDDALGHPECNEAYNLTHPEAVTALHARYFEAGATIVETNTIGGNRVKLAHYGLGDRTYEINRAAAQAARAAVNRAGRCCFVSGAIGPTGHVPATDGVIMPFEELVSVYEEQARGLFDGGVDLILLETVQILRELRAAVIGVRRAMKAAGRLLPLQVQGTFDTHGRMLLGSDVRAFLGAFANFAPDIAGLNCGTGPDEMRPHVEQLLALSPFPVSVLPNAGMPENVDGRAVYGMSPAAFAQRMAPMVIECGVSVVGGCCGTTPEHIRALAEALDGTRVANRVSRGPTCWLGSGISGVDLESLNAPVIVGERLNTQGSRRTKELLLEHNWEELHQVAVRQAPRSALLDLCVALNERDSEADDMTALVAHLSERIETPFCLDTTEPAVLERALTTVPGSVLVNSINLEHGGERARHLLALVREFGCAVIGLTIDDDGMARTVERKVELARRLRDLVCGEFGLPPEQLYIDPLVFTLATGEPESAGAAVDSLEALRRLHTEMPQIRTVMGVSNVSFGLRPPARRVLNNLMLHHAVEAGLRAAIFNPGHIDEIDTYEPEARRLGKDVLLNRSPEALTAFVEHFERAPEGTRPSEAAPGGREAELGTPEQRLRRAVLERDRRGLRELLDQVLDSHKPGAVLNEILLPAMAEVGERMASGKMILPFVLQAAEVMKEAASILEPLLASEEGDGRGTIVLATVYGDVHDIGKNLVGSILRNQGFKVVDLGKQVASDQVVEAVTTHRPVAVGLSALLVTTSREMATVVKLLDEAGMDTPVLVGGAAVNRAFAKRIVQLDGERRYAGGVYYAKDAFQAVRTLEQVQRTGAETEMAGTRKPGRPAVAGTPPKPAPPVILGDRLEPPFYGTGEMLVWEPASLLEAVRRDDLYKGYWRGGALPEEEYVRAVREEFGPAFEQVRNEVIGGRLIDARGYYSFFPVITEDETVVMLDPGDFHTELVSLGFPRVARRGGRSLVDWLRPEGDVLAVQVVTLGARIGSRSAELLTAEDRYSLGFYLNGLANYLTELVAERVTGEIRRALFVERGRGKRFAFGYPGMPGLERLPRLIELIGAEERLGITLTQAYQMVPEHSTLTVFVHHPDADYL